MEDHSKFNMISNFISLNSLQLSFFFFFQAGVKKKVELRTSWACPRVRAPPALKQGRQPQDLDESGLGRWPSSGAGHLGSTGPDRLPAPTGGAGERPTWTRLRELPLKWCDSQKSPQGAVTFSSRGRDDRE